MGNNPSHFSGDNCPVENVSWNDAQEFIKRLNSQSKLQYRLPTEAEWQYACLSGDDDEEYCGGSDVEGFAWYHENSGSRTHQAGTKKPNGFGIYDMSGNVWEWVNDHSGHDCVIRGGSWSSRADAARSLERAEYSPNARSSYIGFRIVAPIIQPD